MTAPANLGSMNDQPPTLPTVGMCRWDRLRHFVPISRESWRKLVNDGRAPNPIRLTERCTMYSNAEVHRWLADPTNYRAQQRAGGLPESITPTIR